MTNLQPVANAQDIKPVQWEALLEQQAANEAASYADGAAAFRRRLARAEEKGQASRIGGVKKLIQMGLDAMTVAIRDMCESPQGGKYGRRHTAAKWCKEVGYEETAYMTLRCVLDGIATPNRMVSTVGNRVAALLLDELRFRRFKKKAPGFYKYAFKHFNTTSYTHMARSLNASLGHAKVDIRDLELKGSQKLLLGLKLVDIMMAATGFVETQTEKIVKRGRKEKLLTPLLLVPTVACAEWLRSRNAALEALQPVLQPMIVPPLAWGKNIQGGYRFALRGSYRMVRRASKKHAALVDRTPMPLVYDAINGLQNTAWQINRRVLAVVNKALTLGGGVAGVPPMEDGELPARPQDMETNEPARRAWRKKAGAVKELNHLQRQQAFAAMKSISAAQKFADAPAFYYPYSLDFRGRIYPIPSYLTPQGDDVARGLLIFADGKPLDASGARWLAIHGANCLGKTQEGVKTSKFTFDERVEWVCANSGRIVAAAAEPFADLWWAKAEKPLQFLAFCFEWSNLLTANDAGQEYICSLPCSMDGSCNGLQHFSAMLRDEIGGRAVNLVPQARPQDIYDLVTQNVLDRLTNLAPFDEHAALWLGLHARLNIVDRDLAKRPTMTFVYGSKKYGFNEQIRTYLKTHQDAGSIREHFTFVKDGVQYSTFNDSTILMAALIWEALNDLVVAAFTGMAWLHGATRGIALRQKPVSWVVPMTNFPVQQEYFQQLGKRVRTQLAGQTFMPTVYGDTSIVNSRKQINAVAPNLIHSLDAAALMMTVVAGSHEGISQWAMIHDSYGTLPADCGLLARCCRQAFVKLYTSMDVAAVLQKQLQAQWAKPEDCPVPPLKGELDVSNVLASPYFFA